MANTYGVNPMVLATAPYATGTVTMTQGSDAVTGSGTTWNSTNTPVSPTTANRDRVYQISIDSGVVWYTYIANADTTHLKLETPFAEATSAGAAYITRALLIPSIKINSIQWVAATANDVATIRDANHNIKVTLKAVAADDIVVWTDPFWCQGFAISALPSGTLYVYKA